MNEKCFTCAVCCRSGYLIPIQPEEEIAKDENYVYGAPNPISGKMTYYMKSNGDGYTCIALRPDFKCGIYDRRPVVCREFDLDGIRCKAIRKAVLGHE